MTHGLLAEGKSAGDDDGLHLRKRCIKVFVDYNVFKFRRMRHFRTRAEEAAGDGLLGIGAAVMQAPFECFDRRGKDENAESINERLK